MYIYYILYRFIRGWYPLTTADKTISWLVFIQVRLRTQEVEIELNPNARVGIPGTTEDGISSITAANSPFQVSISI